MNIGILALQGAFIEHGRMLDSLAVDHLEIRKRTDLKGSFDGLILPGGESTAIGKLLNDLELIRPLKSMIEDGMPVFGTCAGMILLAKGIVNDEAVHLGLMDIQVIRNAYGRQLGSFQTQSNFRGIGTIPMTFIRAPYIESANNEVEILSVVNDHIVAARERNMLVTAFHPELTADTKVHEYFLNQMINRRN